MKLSQILSLALSLVCIIYEIIWMKKNKDIWLIAIPEFVLLVHIVVFYLSYYFYWFPTHYSAWSSALRLQTILTFLLLILFRNKKGVDAWRKII